MSNIPITKPMLGKEEIDALNEVVASGWLTQGKQVAAFEKAVADCTGAAHAVATTSATTALHAALVLKGIGPGDEVIVPSYTWIATPNVVRMVGATPVFADIDLNTFNVTAETIAAMISSKTKAILPVDQFGMPADMGPIRDLADARNLAVIQDAACALGSRYRGVPVGKAEHPVCLSFHPRKLVTTGEGGMLLTDDARLAQQARVLINHGASVSDTAKHASKTVAALLAEEFHQVGFNYRMSNLQGAVGVAQMQRLPEILQARAALAGRYAQALRDVPGVIPAHVPADAIPNWQSYALRVTQESPIARDALAQRLLDAGIACRPAYMACHVQPVYRALYPDLMLPNTEAALREVLLLPLYPQMTAAEQDHVVKHLTLAKSDVIRYT